VNPLTYIPQQVRFVLYLAYAIGLPVMAYLVREGIVGPSEMELFSSLGVVLGATAASNMSSTNTTGDQDA
jgi:hypothetical protein